MPILPTDKITTALVDASGDPVIFGAEQADAAIRKLADSVGRPIDPDQFQAIWESWDDRNVNSYNAAFLGRDFLIKHYNGREYLAFHRAGDIRGNYTDFVDITGTDVTDDLNIVTGIVQITRGETIYTSHSNSSFDVFDFEPIEELNLSAEELNDIYFQHS